MWESIDDESAEKNGIGNLILFYAQALKICEGLELRNLDETVDIVVLE